MKITSFEHACEVLKLDPLNVLPDVSKSPEKHQKAFIANAKLILIVEASREGNDPDWNDRGERKWYPWWDMEVDDNNPSGFRFHASSYGVTATSAAGGSRLVYRSEAESDYHGKRHIDLYRDMMVMAK